MSIKTVFDLKKFERTQIATALTCPINRHATMQKHNCNEWYIHEHPELLIMHFVQNGGASEFAKRRKEFEREVVIPDDDFQI